MLKELPFNNYLLLQPLQTKVRAKHAAQVVEEEHQLLLVVPRQELQQPLQLLQVTKLPKRLKRLRIN